MTSRFKPSRASVSYHNLVVLVPGLSVGNTQNVGGINGPAPLNVGGHGGANSEGRFNVDGLGVNGTSGGGTLYVTDTQNVSEVSIDVTGGLGEAEAGGPVINVVPRIGGNTFSGSVFLDGANGSLQGGNFDDELVAAGLREPGKLKKLWDVNAALGGPIVKDRLWFYLTGRYQRTDRYVAGMYNNKNAGNPNSWVYDPDYSQQALSDGLWHGATLRTTWQISQRQKINFFWDEQDMCRNCTGGGSATTSPEAQDGSQNINYIRAYQAAYTAPLSNRLLIEAGVGAVVPDYGNPREGFDRSMVRVVDQGGNFPNMVAPIPNLTYRSMFWDQVHSFAPRYRASLAYVTGAQNMKVGIETYNNISTRNYQRGDSLQYRFSNGVPNQITMLLSDFTEEAHVRNIGFFMQDRWTLKRFTLQGGIRYENASSGSPEQVIGPSRMVPTPIVFPEQDIVKGYNDITYRGGVAVDVFGTGKTSLKINAGTYMDPAQWAGIFIEPNPARRQFGGGVPPQTTRSWGDANRNYIPDCDLLNPATERGVRAERQPELRAVGDADLHLRSGAAGRLRRAAGQLAVRHRGAAGGLPACVGGSRVPSPELRLVHQPRPGDLDLHADHHVHGGRQPCGDAGRLQPLQRSGAGRSAAALGRGDMSSTTSLTSRPRRSAGPTTSSLVPAITGRRPTIGMVWMCR